MDVVTAIRARLFDQTAVAAIVASRVYAQRLPQGGTLPAIRVQRVDEFEPMQMRGTAGVLKARVQIDSVATGRAAAVALDEAVHGDGAASGLCGFKGYVGSPEFNVSAINPADVREDWEAEELNQYKVMRDYFVSWRR